MTTITTVENDNVYEGFDIRSVKKCTESIFGFRTCIEVIANGDGSVILRLIVESPLGNFVRSFRINSNIDFVFRPIPAIEIAVRVRDFKVTEEFISFSISLSACIELPLIGRKCILAKFEFSVPTPIVATKNLEEMSSGDIALALLAAQQETCKCH